MKFILFEDNYADEFDVHAFEICKDEYWKWYLETAKILFERGMKTSYNIGTNESIEYDSLDDFMSCFQVRDISDDDAIVINEYFPYGFSKGIPELYLEDDDRPELW